MDCFSPLSYGFKFLFEDLPWNFGRITFIGLYVRTFFSLAFTGHLQTHFDDLGLLLAQVYHVEPQNTYKFLFFREIDQPLRMT